MTMYLYGAGALALVLLFIWVQTRVIREDESGLVVRKFGRSLPMGRLIALKGEAGFQAKLLTPGWHFGLWRWQYKVTKVPLNLDLTPYLDEKDNDLIKVMQRAMVR